MNSERTSIVCRGKLVDLSSPVVMGILNVTPDSFFDGGKYIEEEKIIRQVKKMLAEGAAIIDIGAVSSRPGSKPVSEKEEMKRLIPAIKLLVQNFAGIIISADTFRSSVVQKAVEAGASIINDISAGNLDKKMFDAVASLRVPYVLMHMKGTPQTMQKNPRYKDAVFDILSFFIKKVDILKKKFVHDIIIDPGFGFGKKVEHNFTLLKQLDAFKVLSLPLLAGLSRKSMICRTLNVTPGKALNGTTALNMVALMKGANILRVHDVKEAMETIRLFEKCDD